MADAFFAALVRTCLQYRTMLGESVQVIKSNRREGALLLPAAETNKLAKIPCEYEKYYGFAEKRSPLYVLLIFIVLFGDLQQAVKN